MVDILAGLIGAIDVFGYVALAAYVSRRVDAKVKSDIANLPPGSPPEIVKSAEAPRTWHLHSSRFFVLSFAMLTFYFLSAIQTPYLAVSPDYGLLFYLSVILSLCGLLFLYVAAEFVARPHSTLASRFSKVQTSASSVAAPVIRYSFRISAVVSLLLVQSINLTLLMLYYEASIEVRYIVIAGAHLFIPLVGEVYFTTLLASFSGAVVTLYSLLRGRYRNPNSFHLAGLALVLLPWSFIILVNVLRILRFLIGP